jgi:hypothetical protein
MNREELWNTVSQHNITDCKYIAVAREAERLATKYGKDTFDCEDLITILGVGRNNVRELMRSKDFPTLTIGNRKVVSALALAIWLLNNREL